VQSVLTGLGLQQVQDFEKTFARKLQPTDYYLIRRSVFFPQPAIAARRSGGRSLPVHLQWQSVPGRGVFAGCAAGQQRQFAKGVVPEIAESYLAASNLPIWDLMMKNVYSVGYGQLERQDFKLDIVYEEPSLAKSVTCRLMTCDPNTKACRS
jgi:cell surface protein SprA